MGASVPLIALEYRSKPLRGRRWCRWTVAATCLGLVLAGWNWRKPIHDRALLIYWQERCLHSIAPRERVVLDTDVATFERWKGKPGYAVSFFACCGPSLFNVVHTPHDFERFVTANTAAPLPTALPEAVVFLHELRRPDGCRRLVSVRALALVAQDRQGWVSLDPDVWKPASF